MRTGSEYRQALRDGRRVWVVGEGPIDDVTTHPATRAMVDEYVAWYDRQNDPAWADLVFQPGTEPKRTPWGGIIPTRPADLSAMGRYFYAMTFPSGGNITHTPTYGNLIALGIQYTLQQLNVSAEQISAATRYRDLIASTGRFLTFAAGGATIGYRMRPDPRERAALRLVRETDAGLVVTGKISMLTSPAYAEDVYIGSLCGVPYGDHFASFSVAVNAPGVRVLCRRIAARHADPFIAPMSHRFDELDGQIWLDDVLVPWDRVFLMEATPESMASWLFWHQLYCGLAKIDFTLGLALACAHAMGLSEHDQTIEYIVDLLVEAQTIRTCLTAGELEPDRTPQGYCIPGRRHMAVGSIALQKARQRVTEILRILPGSSQVVAPSDVDLDRPELSEALEESFGGGGYTALQRSALLSLAWDHIASGLDGRESAFELHANGGMVAWRGRLRRSFERYNELANGVLRNLKVDMPPIDVSKIGQLPMTPRRQVTPPPGT
ncbi:MAG TPA: 4-hydroxyphenylacetate 3-hydroxylase N-terminal domain-containing protein [Chloroflexota bacterium]